jgi:indole-3-glycerol phosphate synthase
MKPHYRATGTILDRILEHKQQELTARKKLISEDQMRQASQVRSAPHRSLKAALQHGDCVALIAEVKHASPSKGILIDPFDPVALAESYIQNGATALSVLTDEKFFLGHLDHLTAISQALDVATPVLRKDFIVDPYQIYEAAAAGAAAILLIAAVLDDNCLADLHHEAAVASIDALVEVHDEYELERALDLGVDLIGINNRDLRTFEVSLDTTARLARHIPDGVVLVAESGIHSAVDVRRMAEHGVHAVLVGEALVTSGADLPACVREFSSQPRQSALR